MKLIYLAVPYTGMTPSAFFQVTRAMAMVLKGHADSSLIELGPINIFSPITHSHPLTDYDMPQEWSYWERIDCDFLDRVDGLYVLIPDEGVGRVVASTGVNAEIEYAKRLGLPIKFVKYVKDLDKIVEILPGTLGYEELNQYV
jgi:hypothetical protein